MFLHTWKVRPERTAEMGTLEGVRGSLKPALASRRCRKVSSLRSAKGRKVVMLSLPKEVATARTYVVLPQQTASERFVDRCCKETKSRSRKELATSPEVRVLLAAKGFQP
jgi:hypothetical protein